VDESSVASVIRLEQSDFPNMIWIPGGTFPMGSDKHYPEEAPAHRVTVVGCQLLQLLLPQLSFSSAQRRE
jgi:hypothetical protein